MLPSTGLFKSYVCPYYDGTATVQSTHDGNETAVTSAATTCHRPYCHFKHVRKDDVEKSATVAAAVQPAPEYKATPKLLALPLPELSLPAAVKKKSKNSEYVDDIEKSIAVKNAPEYKATPKVQALTLSELPLPNVIKKKSKRLEYQPEKPAINASPSSKKRSSLDSAPVYIPASTAQYSAGGDEDSQFGGNLNLDDCADELNELSGIIDNDDLEEEDVVAKFSNDEDEKPDICLKDIKQEKDTEEFTNVIDIKVAIKTETTDRDKLKRRDSTGSSHSHSKSKHYKSSSKTKDTSEVDKIKKEEEKRKSKESSKHRERDKSKEAKKDHKSSSSTSKHKSSSSTSSHKTSRDKDKESKPKSSSSSSADKKSHSSSSSSSKHKSTSSSSSKSSATATKSSSIDKKSSKEHSTSSSLKALKKEKSDLDTADASTLFATTEEDIMKECEMIYDQLEQKFASMHQVNDESEKTQVAADKVKADLKRKALEEEDLLNAQNKKRVAYENADKHKSHHTPAVVHKPDHRRTAMQAIFDRQDVIKRKQEEETAAAATALREAEEKVREANEALRKVQERTLTPLIPKSYLTPSKPMGRSLIAPVANMLALERAKKKVQELRAEKKPAFTPAQTSKTGPRQAHKVTTKAANVEPEKQPKPPVLEANSTKISFNIRMQYYDMMVKHCLTMYPNAADAWERAQTEELAVFKKCNTPIIYKSSAMLAINKLRKEATDSGNKPSNANKIISHEVVLAGKLANNTSWSVQKKIKNDASMGGEPFDKLPSDKAYEMVYDLRLQDEQLVSNGFPRAGKKTRNSNNAVHSTKSSTK